MRIWYNFFHVAVAESPLTMGKYSVQKVDATSPSKELKKIMDKYEVYGLPTIIFINTKGKVVKELTLTGFEKASLFIKRMDRVYENTEKP